MARLTPEFDETEVSDKQGNVQRLVEMNCCLRKGKRETWPFLDIEVCVD
jgi:hypothetical protein